MIQSESAHSALTQVSKTLMNLELFRTIGSTNQQLATHQHDNITVAPHLLTRYGMEARFASHMPSYCTVASRLTWARLHRQWTVDDWKHVAWSDESCFQLNRSYERIQVWRQPHESMDPTCQQGTAQAGGGSMMVRGVCTCRDMGPLIRLETTLTSDLYVSILSDQLHPFMSTVHSDELGEFQQENATPQTSKIATEWLQEHSFEFRHFCWPPKSPNMNLIEYISNASQRAVQKRFTPLLTPTDLWTSLQDSWYQLPPALLQSVIKSMPRRFVALQRAHGGPT
ncbi:transposable element Tcb2 transposase [Trichonephila clavipes]|nr:transposable element Tcb2 transposase [Trichonephila clavipes]